MTELQKSNMQGRNRDADIENGLVDTAGEGEWGTNLESSIEIYILPCVKQIASGKLLYKRGSSAWCSVMTWRSGVVGGREGGSRRRRYIYTHTYS